MRRMAAPQTTAPLVAASDRLEGFEQSTPALAESYSGNATPQTVLPRHRGGSPFRPRVSSPLDRAKGYAARRPGGLAPGPRAR